LSDSWWAIDLTAYALSRLSWLERTCLPFDRDDVEPWIRRTELSWAPGSGDLMRDIPWDELASAGQSEGDMVTALLRKVAAEALAGTPTQVRLRSGSIGLSARRRLSLSTLTTFTDAALFALDPPTVGDMLAQGCADGHVHQGASLPLECMTHWLARSVRSLSHLSEADRHSPWLSIDGEPYRPEPLVFLLGSIVQRQDEVTALVPDVFAAATGGADAWGRLNERPLPAESSMIPTFAEVVEFKARLRDDDPERWLLYLRCESILHASITQRVTGLDVFVSLFNQLTGIRKTFGSSTEKSDYFASAIAQHVNNTPELVGLELRFGELALTGRRSDGLRELQRDYDAALSGYRSYLDVGVPVRVTFPLGLIKTGAVASRNWRFDIGDACKLIEDLVLLLASRPQLRPFVDGIDVCGLEEACPSWVFAPVFDHFATWCREVGIQPSIRFHAGEWFWTPLQGLRSIDEFLGMPVAAGCRRRIGHGLALDSAYWFRQVDEPLTEVFDDLVWSWGQLTAHDEPVLARATEVALRELVPQVLSPDLAAEALAEPNLLGVAVRAAGLRTQRPFLQRIGLLGRSGDDRLSFLDGTPSPGRALAERLAVAMLQRPGTGPGAAREGRVRDLGDTTRILEVQHDSHRLVQRYVRQRVRDTNTVIEVCPTSNVLAAGVRGYSDHPLRTLIEEGVGCTVNSDDPSLFHAFVGEEIAHIAPLVEGHLPQILALGCSLVGPGIDLSRVAEQVETALT
jgi:hypothetical protein